jgi:hypothetical protein
MPPRAGARLLALLVPAVLLVPSAAHAEKVVTQDAVGDVKAIDFDVEEDFLPAPDHAASDITRTVAAYGETRLSVVVHFRDLVTTSYLNTSVRVRTPRGTYDVKLLRAPGKRATVTLARPRAGEVECRGVRGRFDGGADLVAVSVPTACIASAAWVQLGVGAIGMFEPPVDDPERLVLFADDGHRDTIGENSIGRGPRIRRG